MMFAESGGLHYLAIAPFASRSVTYQASSAGSPRPCG
jgi:hypothetical protein